MEKKDERRSLLKIKKIPTGTPKEKKFVRFADDLGLNLTEIRTFISEVKKIPTYTFPSFKLPISSRRRPNKVLKPLFQQPKLSSNFLNIVETQNVALEYVDITNPNHLQTRFMMRGAVRVQNLDFNKSVHIRYTLNGWRSYTDLLAEYIPFSSDNFTDKFSFAITLNSMEIGQRIEMAIRFSCKGEEFWDNNNGDNYCFQCTSARESKNSVSHINY